MTVLITGGLGFIGAHTALAFAEADVACVLVQRHPGEVPAELADHLGKRIFVSIADVLDRRGLADAARRHRVTGILHLARSVPWPPDGAPIDAASKAIEGLLNVLRVGSDRSVARIGIASSAGVYASGGTGRTDEHAALPVTYQHAVPAFKRISEIVSEYVEQTTGLGVVNYRIATVWGPRGRASSSLTAAPRLVHAVARTPVRAAPTDCYANNGLDLCYVKDCARAIMLLQLASTLPENLYNIASGQVTTNGDIADVLRLLVPDISIALRPGRDPYGPQRDLPVDISRLRRDVGYTPAYDTERAVMDYLRWLRAGHEL
ncbi:NAD-dependent epimerase/dehydratase family protein [Nocardia sp. NPDC059691]|uniref:NAD-dependent epimerase/dehydratase family protein n=1 Tax=Nocardia sp. NPDC059691 TaxID=3346908 RepID=UPI0036784DD0